MLNGQKNRFKTAGLSAEELRRRREEEGIQLRKQRREQQLLKRRNVVPLNSVEVSPQVYYFAFQHPCKTRLLHSEGFFDS